LFSFSSWALIHNLGDDFILHPLRQVYHSLNALNWIFRIVDLNLQAQSL